MLAVGSGDGLVESIRLSYRSGVEGPGNEIPDFQVGIVGVGGKAGGSIRAESSGRLEGRGGHLEDDERDLRAGLADGHRREQQLPDCPGIEVAGSGGGARSVTDDFGSRRGE